MRSLLIPALALGLTAAGLSVLTSPPAQAEPSPVGELGAPVVWTPIDDLPARRGAQTPRVAPTDYAAYRLDLTTLETRLAKAPAETSGAAPVTIAVPAPSGELVEFAVTESPVMEPGLAADHPEISTWAGRTTSGAPASIRLDVTPMGFHASVHGAGASWYVDPVYNGPDQGASAPYVSYIGDDLPARMKPLVEPQALEQAAPTAPSSARRVGEGAGQVAVQRTYRLALVTDNTYAAYFGSTSNAVVTAEKVTLVNRVNHVYGNDFSIRLLLVDDTDKTNLNTAAAMFDAGGPCGPVACYTTAQVNGGCDSPLLDRNRLVVGQLVGAENYDVGHIGLGLDGGGLAGLGVVGTYDKAAGCTGISVPDGDLYAVDYVAHEIGHQFAGNHTFNGTTASCAGGNRNAGTSVEPGSGSSVMAYAGICGIDNLQNHSDPAFSQRSQTEVAAFTRAAPGVDNEIQNIALTGFGSGSSLTIAYGGPAAAPTAYTAAAIKSAVEAAEPSSATATVIGYWGLSTALTSGFQISWSGTADIATPTVTVSSGTAVVGTTDNGGAEDNGGFANPTPTGNRNPTVAAPATRTIPIRTPFTLAGSGSDLDGDPLVYSWEQNDSATTGTSLASNTKPTGPLFRIFGTYADVTDAGTVQYESPGQNQPEASPVRSFPDAAQVAAGETNAATGSCPTLTGSGARDSAALRCFSEFLPTTARTMNFRLTARDLGGADGGTAFADVAISTSGVTPFQVTSQASATAATGGATGTVTWSVGTTNVAPISTANVKVSLSTDGGLTFPTVLSASTPNTGSATITWPNIATSQGRIKVEAVDNYFYDVNDATISITPGAPPTPTLTTGGGAAGQTFTAASSDALSATPTITAESNTVAGASITATIAGPNGLSVTRTATAASGATFQVGGLADVDPGGYPVTVAVSDGPGNAADQTVMFTVTVVKDAATVTYTGDTAGQGGTVEVSATVADTDATPGTVSGSVAFTDRSTGAVLCSAPVTGGTAACPFEAPATRTYAVVATLSSPRYTGASSPAQVVVTVPSLTTGGTAPGQTFQVASSDPLGSAATITATSNTVAGSAITMAQTGLPAGLTLDRLPSSGSSTTFRVNGTADADPGGYPVTVTVSDGAGNAGDRTVTFTVTVIKEAATLTYTGAASGPGGTITASATVVDTDASPGTVVGTVRFRDQAAAQAICTATVASGSASCTFEAPVTRTYQITATLDSARFSGTTSGPTTVDVSVAPPADTTPPDTRITAGPSANSIQVGNAVTFRFGSEPGARYLCQLRGRTTRCDDGVLTVPAPAAGSYDLRVAAYDTAGNIDATPAARRFYVPVRDRSLSVVKGPWQRRTSTAAYRGTYTSVARRGAELRYRVSGATSLALVLSNGRGFGTVDVYLGNRRIGRVSGDGAARTRRVAALTSFARPTDGVVRIVTRNARQVRIEGLAVRTQSADRRAAVRPTGPTV